MRALLEALFKARQKLWRDQELSLGELARKGLRYAQETLTAPLYLAQVNVVGKGVRTLGRPHIENGGRITVGSFTLLRSVNVPVELVVGKGGLLEIGEEVRLNYGVSINCSGSVRIGHRVRIGPYATLIDTEPNEPFDPQKGPPARPIVIEDDVWIGAKASILPGVTIGRASIVGTASVVTVDVPPYSMVLGVPARLVRKLDPSRFVSAAQVA